LLWPEYKEHYPNFYDKIKNVLKTKNVICYLQHIQADINNGKGNYVMIIL